MCATHHAGASRPWPERLITTNTIDTSNSSAPSTPARYNSRLPGVLQGLRNSARENQHQAPARRAAGRAQQRPEKREPGADQERGRTDDPEQHLVRKVGTLHARGRKRASMNLRASAKLASEIAASEPG